MTTETTDRPCRYCGSEVTSRVDTVDYCSDCFYTGTYHTDAFAGLLARMAAPGGVSIGHTGGGCFAIFVNLGASSEDWTHGYLMATGDQDGILPDTEAGPWWVGRYEDSQDEGTIVAEHLDADALVGFVNAATA